MKQWNFLRTQPQSIYLHTNSLSPVLIVFFLELGSPLSFFHIGLPVSSLFSVLPKETIGFLKPELGPTS